MLVKPFKQDIDRVLILNQLIIGTKCRDPHNLKGRQHVPLRMESKCSSQQMLLLQNLSLYIHSLMPLIFAEFAGIQVAKIVFFQ